MLIIVGWNPASPQETMAVQGHPRLYETEAECKMYGEEFLASREIYKAELGEAAYRYFCLPAPPSAPPGDSSRREQ